MSGADIERKIVKYMVESQRSLKEDKVNSFDESFSFEIEIEIGDGQSDIIFVDNQSDPKKLATQFCSRHSLQNYIVQLLTASIREKIEKAKAQTISERFQSQNQELRVFYGNTRPNEVLLREQKCDIANSGEMKKSSKKQEQFASQISRSVDLRRAETKEPCQKVQEESSFLGADKILMGSKMKKSKRVLNDKENINDSQCQKNKVDTVSAQICRRIGKDNIIENCSKASKQRREKMLQEIQKLKEKELRQCVFRPKINKISSKVALQLHSSQEKATDRYERLYEDYKEIEMKKEKSRQNLFAEMSFKPSINHISSAIVSHKNSQVCLQDFRNISKEGTTVKMNKSHCNSSEGRNRPKTGRKPKSRNNQQLPIGQYLYNEAQRRAQKKYTHEKFDPYQALDKSEQIVQNLKQKRIQDIFCQLTPYPHETLSCEELNLSFPAFKKAPLKYFLPIFSEMIELGVSLNSNQFFQASLRMMKNLSPEEKHEIMKKEEKKQQQMRLPPSLVSSKSRNLLRQKQYEENSIYERGLMQRDQARERATKGREERARQELLSCTFKPEVNRIELIQ